MHIPSRPHPQPSNLRELTIPCAGAPVTADLTWPAPAEAAGLVVICHGSGSNRLSPRNRAVAALLRQGGLATLLVDLEPSHRPGHNNRLAELPQLSRRLVAVIDWLEHQDGLRELPLALFGSSTGAAVALEAAAARPQRIRALVSRGGRPDLALPCLNRVRCPILLLVGEHDLDVLELNAWAAAQLQVRHDLVVIPGAGHLFGEPGCLEQVGQLACQWLQRKLGTDPATDLASNLATDLASNPGTDPAGARSSAELRADDNLR